MAINLPQLVIMGGEGGGTIVAEAALSAAKTSGSFMVRGFLNDRVPQGREIYGLPVLGRLDDWHLLPRETVFIPALHNADDMPGRLERILSLSVQPDRWMTVRHPMSWIARDVRLGHGVFVGPFGVIEPGATVGDFSCVRSGAYVSHETFIGDFVFVGANSTISGRCRIGRGTHVGPNTVIRDRLTIAEFTTIGIGSVVTKSVEKPTVIAGNPARQMSKSPL